MSQHTWTPGQISRLGTMSDVEFARRERIALSRVGCKRLALGIPAFRKVKWTKAIIAILGKKTDAQVADILGCGQPLVTRKRTILGIKAKGRWPEKGAK